jgi:uncharacterized protein (DUF2384 family)
MSESSSVERATETRKLAAIMFTDMVSREHRWAFFEQPHPLLLQLRPIDLLDTEEGTAAVLRQLEAAATGAFA